MKDFIFYETFQEREGEVRSRINSLTSYPFTYEEIVASFPHQKAKTRALRLPDEKESRDWFLSIAKDAKKNISVAPVKFSNKAYILLEPYKQDDRIDSVVGVFKTIVSMAQHRGIDTKAVYIITKNVAPQYFTCEIPKPYEKDLWSRL